MLKVDWAHENPVHGPHEKDSASVKEMPMNPFIPEADGTDLVELPESPAELASDGSTLKGDEDDESKHDGDESENDDDGHDREQSKQEDEVEERTEEQQNPFEDPSEPLVEPETSWEDRIVSPISPSDAPIDMSWPGGDTFQSLR